METRAINRKLMKQLTDERLRMRTFGKQRAIKIGARLDEFKAAQHLTEISSYHRHAYIHYMAIMKDYFPWM